MLLKIFAFVHLPVDLRFWLTFLIAVAVDGDMIGGRHEAGQLCEASKEHSSKAVGGDVGVGDVGLLDGTSNDAFVLEEFISWWDCMLHPIWVHAKLRWKEPLHMLVH